jgi:LysR family hydrogen peroxide-inducible transcriptional activator
METRLGCPLFYRGHNTSLVPTPAGRAIIERGSVILNLSEQLDTVLDDLSCNHQGHLRIGASRFYSKYFVSDVIGAYCRKYPHTRIVIEEDQSTAVLESMTNAGKLDLCIAPLPLSCRTLSHIVIRQEEILLAIPKSHAINSMVIPSGSEFPYFDLHQAKYEDFVFLNDGHRFNPYGMKICHDFGFSPHIVIMSSSWDTVCAYIANGLGIGFVTDILARNPNNQSRVTFCRLLDYQAQRPLSIAYSQSRLSATSAQFINFITETISNPSLQ